MIVRAGGRNVELRTTLGDLARFGYQGLRSIVPSQVTTKDVQGAPALYRAARIRAEALASQKLRCWSGEGSDRARRDQVWQAQLFASATANEYQTRFNFWETVGESLAWRNNSYVWKNIDPLSGRIVEWFALHPDQVLCKGRDDYEIVVKDGYLDPVGNGNGKYRVSDETLLHIRGYGDGGMLEAPSPFQVFQEAMAAPILRQRHENRMWRRGTGLQMAVEFPVESRQEDADNWKETFRSTFQGTDGDTAIVVGGGATIKPIGLTPADAQFVEMARLSVEDAALIMGVPAALLGWHAGERSAAPTLESELTSFLRFGHGPDLFRIEDALMADETIFPPGAHTFPQFETDGFVRGDLATEDAIAHNRIQDGRITVNEWRASQGLAPVKWGDEPQKTPVGGAPNPAAPAAPVTPSE